MSTYVVDLAGVDRHAIAVVGGKGAHLGELARIDGVRVPPGFCVTTDAFRRALAEVPEVDGLLARLAGLTGPADTGPGGEAAELGARIRRALEAAPVPDDVADAVVGALERLGEDVAVAVRSSATAEDGPATSAAGLQDSFLNVVGPAAVLDHVRRCWASLFTDRAVAYRVRNGLDHRRVHMAVVVQRLVVPRVAGVLFTADPVTSDRTVTSVEAVLGLGEALVGGRVAGDVFRVRRGRVVASSIAHQDLAVRPLPGGGTGLRPVDAALADRPRLGEAEVLALAELGRRIEERLGGPQDVEWCLDDEGVHVVQARPITTLFPVPVRDDEDAHVYLSVGHQQMMTDPMRPLGLSLFRLTALPPMHEAGGRLFVDVTAALSVPSTRAGLLEVVGRGDPLVRDALETVLARGDLVPEAPEASPAPGPPPEPPPPIEVDPAVVDELMAATRASVDALREELAGLAGPALVERILADIPEMKRILFDPRSHQVFMGAMEAAWWLDEHLGEWLGERGASDVLSRAVPRNVTSEMGLALLDVADVVRPHPEVVALLEAAGDDDGFLDRLPGVPGGAQARDALLAYLDAYGMRCIGEIDVTRPRWSERPSMLLPMLLADVRSFGPGEAGRRVGSGRRAAAEKEHEVLERLRALPDGAARAQETAERIHRLRTYIGYREFPKYGMVSRYFVYKQALVAEADRLVDAGVFEDREDLWWVTLPELLDVVRDRRVDRDLLRRRREDFDRWRSLHPPRVLTSDGEALSGSHRRDGVPPGALVGLGVSAGTVEGRARVMADLGDAAPEPGDILVTTHTDPSWSPLFVAVAGLVTEVGGLMTHGAVIAREYGLPAVVGVGGATRLLADGQWIRVDGTDGVVEVLPDP